MRKGLCTLMIYTEPSIDVHQAGLAIDNILDSMQRLLPADINHNRQEAMVKEDFPSAEIQSRPPHDHSVNE